MVSRHTVRRKLSFNSWISLQGFFCFGNRQCLGVGIFLLCALNVEIIYGECWVSFIKLLQRVYMCVPNRLYLLLVMKCRVNYFLMKDIFGVI